MMMMMVIMMGVAAGVMMLVITPRVGAAGVVERPEQGREGGEEGDEGEGGDGGGVRRRGGRRRFRVAFGGARFPARVTVVGCHRRSTNW